MPVVLISGARSPVCLDLARSFFLLGWTVNLVDFQRFPLARFSRSCSKYWRLPPPSDLPHFHEAWCELLQELGPDLVVPTCEELFWLRQSYNGSTLLCPQLDMLLQVHHKYSFVELCQRLELAVPESFLFHSWTDFQTQLNGLPWLSVLSNSTLPVVIKPAFSRFGFEQRLSPTLEQVRNAVDGNRPWVCQSFVKGKSYCSYSVAHDGQLQAHVCYRPIMRLKQGAGVAIETVSHPEILEWIAKFVAATNWTGQVAFDFIQSDDGVATAIECNPRSTSGIHLFQGRQATQLAQVLVGALSDRDLLTPPAGSQAYLEFPSLASWVATLPRSLFDGGLGQLCRLFLQGEPVVYRRSDLGPCLGQVFGFGELALSAAWNGRGLLAQSTYDIEWNGRP